MTTEGAAVLPKPTDQEQIIMRFNDLYWNAKPYGPIAQRLAAAAAQAIADIEATKAQTGRIARAHSQASERCSSPSAREPGQSERNTP